MQTSNCVISASISPINTCSTTTSVNSNNITNTESVLSALRNLDNAIRSELLATADKDENVKKEAVLLQASHLKLETQLNKVLNEIQDLRSNFQEYNLVSQAHINKSNNIQYDTQDLQDINVTQKKTQKQKQIHKNNINILNENNNIKKCPFLNSETFININNDLLEDYDSYSIFSFELLPIWIFFILIVISLLPQIKSQTRLFQC